MGEKEVEKENKRKNKIADGQSGLVGLADVSHRVWSISEV